MSKKIKNKKIKSHDQNVLSPRAPDTAVGELGYFLDSLNTAQLSISLPDKVGILVGILIITLAVAAAK